MHSKNRPAWTKHPELELTTYVFRGRRRAPTKSVRGIHCRADAWGIHMIKEPRGPRRGTHPAMRAAVLRRILGADAPAACDCACFITGMCSNVVLAVGGLKAAALLQRPLNGLNSEGFLMQKTQLRYNECPD